MSVRHKGSRARELATISRQLSPPLFVKVYIYLNSTVKVIRRCPVRDQFRSAIERTGEQHFLDDTFAPQSSL